MQSLYRHERKMHRRLHWARILGGYAGRHPGRCCVYRGLVLELLPFSCAVPCWPAFLETELQHLCFSQYTFNIEFSVAVCLPWR